MARRTATKRQASRKPRKITVVPKEPVRGEPIDKSLEKDDLAQILAWYHQKFDKNAAKEFIIAWAKENDDDELRRSARSCPPNLINSTFAWICRMEMNGCRMDGGAGPEKLAENQKKRREEVIRFANLDPGESRPYNLPVYKNPHIMAVQNLKDDEEKIVAYIMIEDVGTRSLNKILEMFPESEEIAAAVEAKREENRQKRKPRRKKIKSPEELTADVRYAKKAKGLKPVEIFGKSLVVAYDIHKKKLIFYYANGEGISFKGTTLQNVTEAKAKQLRWPEKQVPKFMQLPIQRAKDEFAALSTKESDHTTRTNPGTVFLKAF